MGSVTSCAVVGGIGDAVVSPMASGVTVEAAIRVHCWSCLPLQYLHAIKAPTAVKRTPILVATNSHRLFVSLEFSSLRWRYWGEIDEPASTCTAIIYAIRSSCVSFALALLPGLSLTSHQSKDETEL